MNSDPTGYFTLFELSAAICLDNSLEGQYNSAIVSGFSDFMEALKNGERDPLTLLQTFFNTFASEVCPGYDFYMSVCQCNTTGDYEAALEIALGTAFNASVKFSGFNQSFKSDNTGARTCKVPGRVQSRINIAKGRTKTTPLRESGEPVSAGFEEHVVPGHFDRPLSNSRSIFSITPDELKAILQCDNVVNSPVTAIDGGQYLRIVDTEQIVGNTALKFGGGETSWIAVYTDRAGNLITTYPVPKPN